MKTLGWMVSAWLGLSVLQLVTTTGGSGKFATLLATARNVFDHALDPGVPAIPDLRKQEPS
ncbi:MAG: hypothetical protein FWF90_17360 [Promicromonosporaceae bacterium]|nr:hypothetical protein [Promicromonosporaceae bacterium]